MEDKPQIVSLRYYGISPWEIEVIYNIFNKKFEVIQDVIERDEYLRHLGSKSLQMDCEECVSALTITIPLPFSEEFFKWFEFKRWEKIKSIIKEMKRRRGSGNAIKIEIIFIGEPSIRFIIDLHEKHFFNNATEKIDNIVELLQYHLSGNDTPENVSEVVYKFDTDPGRWKLNMITADDKKFISTEKGWKIFT